MAADNGPKTVVALWAMTAVSFLFMNLRFFCKGVYTRQLRVDDAVLLLSWIFVLLYASLITVSVKNGMGKHAEDLNPDTVVPMYKFLFLGEFFTLLAIPASKSSFLITLLRIATKRWQFWFIWFVIVTINIVYWVTAILLLVQCQPIAKNWNKDMPGSCWKSDIQDNYSVFSAAYSAILDFVLATFPCLIIYHLQMSTKEKIGVIAAMSLGFLAGITGAVKIKFLPGIGHFTDPTFQLGELLIWSNAEVAVTIVAASIPFFRVLLRQVSSYNRSKPKYRQSYRLESFGREGGALGNGRNRSNKITDIGAQDDNISEQSILRDGVLINGSGGTIVKSSEVVIEFSDEKSVKPREKV